MAALQALAVAYVVGLLVAAVVVAAAPVLVAAVAVAPGAKSHWFRRPAALGALLGIGTAGSVALAIRLLGTSSDDIHFVRPFVPALVAAPVDVVLLIALAVRGARSARAAVGSADLRAGATSLAALAFRAACRGAAVVVFGAGSVILLGGIGLTVDAKSPEASGGGFILLGAIGAFAVGGLGSLLAWWGRAKRG